MRLAIMQPYFLPYVGYFSLIAATDRFVVFDPVQYIRHGWVNRNRILKPNLVETQYVTLPLAAHSRDTPIRDILLSSNSDWKKNILAQLQHYRKRAPYFDQANEILKQCFDCDTNRLVELNLRCLEVICRWLAIDFNVTRFDEIEDAIVTPQDPGEWALNISAALGATTYLNPVGGRDLFEPQKFRERGVELTFLENRLESYSQRNGQFVAGLSVVDLLMFNSLEATKKLIEQYEILSCE